MQPAQPHQIRARPLAFAHVVPLILPAPVLQTLARLQALAHAEPLVPSVQQLRQPAQLAHADAQPPLAQEAWFVALVAVVSAERQPPVLFALPPHQIALTPFVNVPPLQQLIRAQEEELVLVTLVLVRPAKHAQQAPRITMPLHPFWYFQGMAVDN